MKRSLTIGCVLLVGGGVSSCGGSAELGTPAGNEQGEHAGSGGSGAQLGISIPPNYSGSGGTYVGVGSVIGDPVCCVAGAPSIPGTLGDGGATFMGTAPEMGVAGAGAAGWDGAGEGGTAGSNDEPPAIGTAPLGGSGGGFFIGDYK